MPEELYKHDGKRRIALGEIFAGKAEWRRQNPSRIPTTRGIWKRPQSLIGSQIRLMACRVPPSMPSLSFMRTTRATNLARSCARSAFTLIPRLLRTSAGVTLPVELASDANRSRLRGIEVPFVLLVRAGSRRASRAIVAHGRCEDCSAEWASPSLGDLESGVSQPAFWQLSNISTALCRASQREIGRASCRERVCLYV